MRITERDIQRFTCGDCHFLAKRLHRVAGLPMHAFKMPDEEKPTRHAFVKFNTLALDVNGLHDMDFFIEEWGAEDISEPLSVDWFAKNWRRPNPAWGHYTYQRAREIADYLIEEYEIDFSSSRCSV